MSLLGAEPTSPDQTPRLDVEIASGRERLAAWWYPPSRASQPAPCVILAHGFGGIKEMRLWAYAERFAAAGIGALVFDYRHFGGSSGQPRNLVDPARQREDWAAAIRYARTREDIDPARIALWGTSFSAGQAIIYAASDATIAAVIAQAPFADGLAALKAMPPSHGLRLLRAGLLDAASARLGRPPRMLKAAGLPGDHDAVMTTPDALVGMMALVPPGVEFENAVCARIALRVGTIRPIRHAPNITCPLLVQVLDHDQVTPTAPAAALASRAPRGELLAYPGGHFEAYTGPLFQRFVHDQLAFLNRHLVSPA
jgi:uncharacterized protein